MFDRWVCPGCFIQVGVSVIGMPCDEAVLGPPGQCTLTDSETRRRLSFCQHSSVAESVIARTKPVFVGEIGDAQSGEPSIGLSLTCGTARADSTLVQNVSDLGIGVFVEELVNEFDYLWS
jgi:hypothetical protein